MSRKKQNTPAVHKEYLNILRKELNALLKILKYSGKVQWGVYPKDNENIRSITKRNIDLSENVFMQMCSKWRFIDVYYEAVIEFENSYEEVFAFASKHSLSYENFLLPDGKLLVAYPHFMYHF